MLLLREVEMFVEIVRARSFKGGAQRLSMPVSTLSRRIAKLERELGVLLLNRTTRNLEVTEAGANYFKRCSHLIEEMRSAHESFFEATKRVQGTLRLSCTADFATHYLPDVLIAFAKANPETQVELDLSHRRIDLISENVDAALRIGALSDSSLVARRVSTLDSWLVASPDYLSRYRAPEDPADLCSHAFVRLQAPTNGKPLILQAESGKGPNFSFEAPSRFSAGSMVMARELVLRGAGIGLIDARIAAKEVQQGSLRRVLPAWRGPGVPLHLVTASRLWPARLTRFADHLSTYLARPSKT